MGFVQVVNTPFFCQRGRGRVIQIVVLNGSLL